MIDSIPKEFGNLSLLVEFVAYTNSISGSLPRSIGNPKQLQKFRAGQTSIRESLPVEIENYENLQYLDLAQTELLCIYLKRLRLGLCNGPDMDWARFY